MPLPNAPTRKGDKASLPSQVSKADKDLLIKGVLCVLIGAIILLAPYVARSSSVQELMGGASAVGWFTLVLGCAFIALFGRRRWAASRIEQG